jgi:hypothetical protein
MCLEMAAKLGAFARLLRFRRIKDRAAIRELGSPRKRRATGRELERERTEEINIQTVAEGFKDSGMEKVFMRGSIFIAITDLVRVNYNN